MIQAPGHDAGNPRAGAQVNATLYAYPPGQAQRQSTGITQGFCPNTAPAGVDSMQPLAGIPFYTTR